MKKVFSMKNLSLSVKVRFQGKQKDVCIGCQEFWKHFDDRWTPRLRSLDVSVAKDKSIHYKK